MIISSMTYEEAANEIRIETPTVVAKMRHLNSRFVSLASKARKFPFLHSFFYKTPGGNDCIITFLCESKKSLPDNTQQSIHYVWEAREGKTCATILHGQDVDGVVQIFTPHCLSRFRERFLKDRPMIDRLFLIKFIQSFARMISNPVNKEICPNEENLSTDDEAKMAITTGCGVFFGSIKRDCLHVFVKTFVTYDMLYPEQLKALDMSIRRIRYSPHVDPLDRGHIPDAGEIQDLGKPSKFVIKEEGKLRSE